uniref:hypothetical protein n=1 Tax=Enterococcus faecium TaxID=1352 RepID=UPI002852CD44|nr:hypothetical protein [Enterococcus faecium]WLW33360.1 hypothetical protein HFKLHIGP_00145 [Enterococcus faecium]WLW33664.1 hypothetical protein AIOPLDIF_00144 [Enterococcus faecium]
MNQKTSKVEKEFYLRCSYLTLSVLFDKEPILTGVRNLCPERVMKFWQFTAIQELAQATKITKHKFKH